MTPSQLTLSIATATYHSLLWRAPGGRTLERERFHRLMRKVEAIRLRYGMSKMALAAELETTPDALRSWMSGRTVGRKETVAKSANQIRLY
jgi:hypothetical protein